MEKRTFIMWLHSFIFFYGHLDAGKRAVNETFCYLYLFIYLLPSEVVNGEHVGIQLTHVAATLGFTSSNVCVQYSLSL